MEPMKNIEQDGSAQELKASASDTVGEDVVAGIAALVGILLTGLLYLVFPPNILIGPNWLLLSLEVVFVVPVFIDLLSPWNLSHMVRRIFVLIPLSVSTVALVGGVALLLLTLSTDKHASNLLRSAALLWTFNILTFALWYWEIDGGGPWKRHLPEHRGVDFLFPQQTRGMNWTPHFLDYLFLAFTGATALSPADTNPLTKSAKVLMMIEAMLSLIIIGLLIGRSVNILGG